MRYQKILLATSALALAATVSTAAITLDPVTAGASVNVTGSGASANGPVELWVNNVSQGSLQADGSGNFTFSGLTIADGDVLYATASQVWHFNTNADFEGWAVASGGIGAVSGGLLTVTGDGTTNITLNLASASPVVFDSNVTRVFEMRYRITGAFTPGSGSTVIYDPGSGFQFGQGFNPTANGNFVTTHVDLSTDNTGAANNYTSTGSLIQLAPGANGFGAGAVMDVDYIRVSEGFLWDFGGDDTMMWGAQAAVSSMVVAGGAMTVTADGNPNPSIWLPFNWVDTDHFKVWSQSIAVNSVTPGQADILAWVDNGGADNYFANGNSTNQSAEVGSFGFNHLFTADGNQLPFSLDLSTASGATWGQDPTSIALLFTPFVNAASGETAVIDYLRLHPANSYGPSAAVTATASAGVQDWEMFR